MDTINMKHLSTFETLVASERTNLLRFCAYLTGSPRAAEDLTQETLLTAWRRREMITDPSGLSQWLKAIARNVCRHWQRRQTRRQKYLPEPNQPQDNELNAMFEVPDTFDLDLELERHELITLLDQALALLPSETRGLLIQHYIEELPQAELATQAGLSTGAVAVRLHRGKLALRQALVTDFQDDAVAYGLVAPGEAGWVETRIWCFGCGQQRLQGRFNHADNLLCLRCPNCCDVTAENDMISESQNDVLQGIKAFKPAFLRVMKSVYTHYFERGNTGTVPCYRCGQLNPIRIGVPPWLPGSHKAIYDWCERCHEGTSSQTWSGLALTLPQVHQFWRDHPRMVELPNRPVEIAGTPAMLTGFESVTDKAKIEVAFSKNTFEVIYID